MLWLQIASQIGIVIFTFVVQMQMQNNLYVPEIVGRFIDAASPHLVYIAEEVALSFRSYHPTLPAHATRPPLIPSQTTVAPKDIILWTPTTIAVPIQLYPQALATPFVAASSVLTTSKSMPTLTQASATDDTLLEMITWPSGAIDVANHFCPAHLATIVPACHLRPVHIVAVALTLAMVWGACVLVKLSRDWRGEGTSTTHSGLRIYTPSNIVAKLMEIFYGGAPSQSRTSSLDNDGVSSTISSASADRDTVLTVLQNTNNPNSDAKNTTGARTEKQTETTAAHGGHSTSGSSKSSCAPSWIAPMPEEASLARTAYACERYSKVCAEAIKIMEYHSARPDLLREAMEREREGFLAFVEQEVQRAAGVQAQWEDRCAELTRTYAAMTARQAEVNRTLEVLKSTRARLDLESAATRKEHEQRARERAQVEQKRALIESERMKAEKERKEATWRRVRAIVERKELEEQREMLEKEHARLEAERKRLEAERRRDQEAQTEKARHVQDQVVQTEEKVAEHRDAQTGRGGLCEEGMQTDGTQGVREQDVQADAADHLCHNEAQTDPEEAQIDQAERAREQGVETQQEELLRESHEHMHHDVHGRHHSETEQIQEGSIEGEQADGRDSRGTQDSQDTKPVEQAGLVGSVEQVIQPVQDAPAQHSGSSGHGFTLDCAPPRQPTPPASPWLQEHQQAVQAAQVAPLQVVVRAPSPESDPDDSATAEEQPSPPSPVTAAIPVDTPSPDFNAALLLLGLSGQPQAQDVPNVQVENGGNTGQDGQQQVDDVNMDAMPQLQGGYQPTLDSSYYQPMPPQSWQGPSSTAGRYGYQWAAQSLPAVATEQQFAIYNRALAPPQTTPLSDQGPFTHGYVTANAVNLSHSQSYYASSNTYQGFASAAPKPGPSNTQYGQGTQGMYNVQDVLYAQGLQAEYGGQAAAYVQSSPYSFESSDHYSVESSRPYSFERNTRSGDLDTNMVSSPQPPNDQSGTIDPHSQQETSQFLPRVGTGEQLPPDRLSRSDQSASPCVNASADPAIYSPLPPDLSMEGVVVSAPPTDEPSSSSGTSAPPSDEPSSTFTFTTNAHADGHATPAAILQPQGVMGVQLQNLGGGSNDDDSVTEIDEEAFMVQVNAILHRQSVRPTTSTRSGRQRGGKSKP
ncbi:hypothetical protein IEO21_08627 [Rhodonia placenta]|uniref:Uncharacterized protein n=1 Tax=Rhodonia placenta TaxID=104341 RepID=A0A8H7NVZ7_9APHY|nr:hypothetical protein IEO21_08627 [Postia placenta]